MTIRLYIISMLTSVVFLISAALSYQSVRLFFEAIDMVASDAMLEAAYIYLDQDKNKSRILGYDIANSWQALPEQVQEAFVTPPEEANVRFYKFYDWIFIRPPEIIVELMRVNIDGQELFVFAYDDQPEPDADEPIIPFEFDPMQSVVLLGVFALIIFILSLLFIFRQLAKPIEALRTWAKTLSIAQLEQPTPDFAYQELNDVAELMHQNVSSVASAVERERAFLSYASHELRTPIMVLMTNIKILNKLEVASNDKEQAALNRIDRATQTMKSMTETLLWLSRESDDDNLVQAQQKVHLASTVMSINSDLSYLLQGKSVKVAIATDNTELQLAATPCLIVLTNLIRNAFQHTLSGEIRISQVGSRFTICNSLALTECLSEEGQGSLQVPIGFGIGIELVEKLVKKCGWSLYFDKTSTEFTINLNFNPD